VTVCQVLNVLIFCIIFHIALYRSTWITDVPTFSFSITTGLYDEQSGNLGALLLTSLISMTTTPRLLRLVVPPQQRPLSVAVTFRRYDPCDLSSAPTSVMMPDLGSILNGPSTSGPPGYHTRIILISETRHFMLLFQYSNYGTAINNRTELLGLSKL